MALDWTSQSTDLHSTEQCFTKRKKINTQNKQHLKEAALQAWKSSFEERSHVFFFHFSGSTSC